MTQTLLGKSLRDLGHMIRFMNDIGSNGPGESATLRRDLYKINLST
jgi:hypothetical protein